MSCGCDGHAGTIAAMGAGEEGKMVWGDPTQDCDFEYL